MQAKVEIRKYNINLWEMKSSKDLFIEIREDEQYKKEEKDLQRMFDRTDYMVSWQVSKVRQIDKIKNLITINNKEVKTC